MNPIKANMSAFRHAFKWKSRAPRSEYWWVLGTLVLGVVLAAIIDEALFKDVSDGSALYMTGTIAFMFFYIPWLFATFVVTIRRLHDLDMSGWYVLIYILPLGLGFVFMAFICSRRGTPGPNRFGPDPLYQDPFEDAEVFG